MNARRSPTRPPAGHHADRLPRRVLRSFLRCALAGVLAACSALPPLTPPAASGRQLAATQWLHLSNAQQSVDAICLLEIDGTTLKMVATTPQGQTLLQAELGEDGILHTRMAPWLTQSGLSAEAIASDIQIALWPVSALEAAGWTVEENASGEHRSVQLHGKQWAHIVYEGGQQQPQRILIQRGDGLYSVELRTLEWTTP